MAQDSKIKISTGPQFREGNAVVPFFIVAILILIAVISIIQGDLQLFCIMLPLIVCLINFILDFQGLEIDKEKCLVRIYKLDFFWKYGQWQDFKTFYAIGLNYENYTIKEWTPYTNLTTVGRNDQFTNVRYGSFFITLENKNTRNNIVLAERQEYHEAITVAMNLSEKTGLPFHDIYKERVEESKIKRMNN